MSKKKIDLTPAPKPAELEETPPPCCGVEGCLDCPYDDNTEATPATDNPLPVVASTVSTEEPADNLPGYVVNEGDTYASIAAVWKHESLTTHQYAQRLFEKNKGATLTPGKVIKL